MFTDTNIGKDGLDELREISQDRDVLYVFPGMGEMVKSLSIAARSVWAVGNRLHPANEHDPTDAAELVHNLESNFLSPTTTVLLGHAETVLSAIIGLRFDLAVIDWSDARDFTPGLLWKVAAMSPRIVVVGWRVGPRAQVTEHLFRGTGYLHYEVGTTVIFTDPRTETVREAEVY